MDKDIEEKNEETIFIGIPELARITNPGEKISELIIQEGSELCVSLTKINYHAKNTKKRIVEHFSQSNYHECLRCKKQRGLLDVSYFEINGEKTNICIDCVYVIFRDLIWKKGHIKD